MALLLPLLAIAIAAPAASADRAADRACENTAPRHAGETLHRGAPATPHRLDQQPPAAHYLTLFRTVDGCLSSVIVRSDIGAAARR